MKKLTVFGLCAVSAFLGYQVALNAEPSMSLSEACNLNKADITQAWESERDSARIYRRGVDMAELDVWAANWSKGQYGSFSDLLVGEGAECAEAGIDMRPTSYKGAIK